MVLPSGPRPNLPTALVRGLRPERNMMRRARGRAWRCPGARLYPRRECQLPALRIDLMSASPAQSEAALGALPGWDLSDLYPGRNSPELQSDIERSLSEAKAFQERNKGKLAQMNGAELAQAIGEYERLRETTDRIMSYASLTYSVDMADPAIGQFYQTMHERTNEIGTALLFFTLEINKID